MIGGLFVASTVAYAKVGSRVVPIALPDDFLVAGALPTLHDRYIPSTDVIVSKVKAELGEAAAILYNRPPCSHQEKPMSVSDYTAVVTGTGTGRHRPRPRNVTDAASVENAYHPHRSRPAGRNAGQLRRNYLTNVLPFTPCRRDESGALAGPT